MKNENSKKLAIKSKSRWKIENLKNWQSKVSLGYKKNDENLKNWQSEVSPDEKIENLKKLSPDEKKMKIWRIGNQR